MRYRQPIWPRFLPLSTIMAIARVGPLGRMRRAPGTFGTLGGMLYQLLLFHNQHPVTIVVLSAIGLWFAAAICGEAEFRLGRRDPGEVVLDEFIVMPVCFIGWPAIAGVLPDWAAPWSVFFVGFLLFRFFDILKPLGISKLQDLPAGIGVVADDLAAALATCGVMHAAALAWTFFGEGG